jgi:hypothetical protein
MSYPVLRGPQVDTSNWLQSFRQGGADRQQDEQRNLLKEVGGDMASGNLLGAASKAYKGGEVDTGLALTKHKQALDLNNQETQLKLLDFFGRGAQGADTPEKREAVFKIAEGVFGANRVAPLRGVPWEQVVAGFNDEKTKLERQKLQAETQKLQAETTRLGQKNALDEAIAQLLRGGDPSAAAAQPPATYQPQSYEGPLPDRTGLQQTAQPLAPELAPQAAPPQMQSQTGLQPPAALAPGIQLAADDLSVDNQSIDAQAQTELTPQTETPSPAPQSPGAVYDLPGEETINTPFGQMTRDKARKLGMALAAGGKGEAGKMMIDAASGGADRAGKAGQNKVDLKQIDAVNHISRLNEVSATMKPEYLQIPTRVGMEWKSLKAKFGKLPANEQTELSGYATARRAAVDNMSRLLNELSGAAVSPQEYKRIIKTQPDAGIGMLDGDDPVTFEAKLQGARRQQLRAIARYNYIRRRGFAARPWEAMELEDVDAIIDKRGAELEREISNQNPGVNTESLQQELKRRLSKEFGIPI